jgi:hypothetical protein
MTKKLLIIILVLLPSCVISQTISDLNSIIEISNKSSTQVDSILVQMGFQNTSIEGLKFTYSKKSEVFVMQTIPRQLTYAFTDKASYLKINSEVSSQGYQLVNGEEITTYNNKPKTVSTFEKSAIKISFGTDLNTANKVTTYCLWITNSNPKYLNATVKTVTEKQEEIPKGTKSDRVNSTIETGLFGTVNSKSTSEKLNLLSDSSIALAKNRTTIGASVYNYNTAYNGYNEVLFNLQFGVEISKAKYMKKKKNYFVDTRINLDASIFLDMQKYYPSTGTTMYLTKYYFTMGMISEIRKKKNSFLMSVDPGLNWTTGKIDSDRASFITPCVHFGEYIQRAFGTSKMGTDKLFLRLGFDQYFSSKGGYIGSFGLTLGF